MRVTWLTDLHLDFLDDAALAGFLAIVRAERPELLLVSGDTGESRDIGRFVEQLSAIAPVYFVLGNHDFYGATIAAVREHMRATSRWLPGIGPVRLTEATTLVGVDGWGDARCGDLASQIKLSDWHYIGELRGLAPEARIAALRALGSEEATTLQQQLARTPASAELLVVTHVPPFAQACWYNGQPSDPAWLPWFTCIAVGDVLLAHADAHPATLITVLCGHTHGRGEYRARPNLLVRTGGWPPNQSGYGNPLVQATWSLA